jgi:hypothetical protein
MTAALAARLGVETIGETIKGVFGLASATVTAAGEAAKGVGTAVGGALEGAMTPAPVTVVNNVGMAGQAAKAKVTGGGSIPAAPKKSAKPVANAKMPTEKLLVIAVNYLSSIEKTLVDQLNFERSAASQQAAAEREAAIENEQQATSPFKSLGEKLGAIKNDAGNRVGTAAKILLGGAALGTFGLLGLGEMDTTELDRLKQNWSEFQEQYKFIFDAIEKVYNFLGPEALGFGTLGYFIGGWRGGLIGLVAGKVYELTDSEEIAAAAGGAAGLLTFKTGRRLAMSAARAAVANPLAVAAGGATTAVVAGVDYGAKAIQSNVNTTAEQWENSFGLYVQSMSKNGFERQKYKIKIDERGINFFNVPKGEIEGEGHSENERFYFWNRVHVGIPSMRDKKANDAREWLRTKGQAWLNKYYPVKTNASPVPTQNSVGDAAPATPVSPSPDATALPPAAAGSIDAILNKTPEELTDAELRQLVEAQGRIEDPRGVMNNPGGIRYGTGNAAVQEHQIAFRGANADSSVKIAVYDTPENGILAAMENWRTSRYYKGRTIRDGLGMWSTGYYGRNANYEKMLGSAAPGYTGTDNPQGESGSIMSSLGSLTKGGMQAIGSILKAGLDPMTPTSGSQLSGFNDNMQGNVGKVTMSTPGAVVTPTAAPVQGESAVATQLARTSAQIQNAVDLGNADAAQAATQQESAGAASIRQANASNDGKLECLDPNFPGNGAVEAYLQYHRLAA